MHLEPKESMYGSLNRLNWFKQFLNKDQTIVDIGCGTGSMITIPLIAQGYNIIGLDLDQKSIDYGRNLLGSYNLDSDRLKCMDFGQLDLDPDIIILSEVLEHLSTDQLNSLISLIHRKLKPGGLLLITVPNGYGWFEFESFLWYKMKLGWMLEKLYIVEGVIILKNKLFGNTIEPHPSSLDCSGHIQQFSYSSLEKTVGAHGFNTTQKQGGSMISGPLSNLFFTGIKPVMKLNLFLGKKLSRIASDFYISVQKK